MQRKGKFYIKFPWNLVEMLSEKHSKFSRAFTHTENMADNVPGRWYLLVVYNAYGDILAIHYVYLYH